MMWVKCLVWGFMGSLVEGGLNTPWRAEYHFCREVQTQEKQAWRRKRASVSWASEADRHAERQRCPEHE